jgi:hypothetical protein
LKTDRKSVTLGTRRGKAPQLNLPKRYDASEFAVVAGTKEPIGVALLLKIRVQAPLLRHRAKRQFAHPTVSADLKIPS